FDLSRREGYVYDDSIVWPRHDVRFSLRFGMDLCQRVQISRHRILRLPPKLSGWLTRLAHTGSPKALDGRDKSLRSITGPLCFSRRYRLRLVIREVSKFNQVHWCSAEFSR